MILLVVLLLVAYTLFWAKIHWLFRKFLRRRADLFPKRKLSWRRKLRSTRTSLCNNFNDS